MKINNKLFFDKRLYDVGITTISDLCNVHNTDFLTYEEFCQCYNVKNCQMNYNRIISAVPTTWKKCVREMVTDLEIEIESNYDKLSESAKWSSCIYSSIISRSNAIQKYINIFNEKFGIRMNETQVRKVLIDLNKITDIVKYRSFQYRFLNNAIFLNDRLYHAKISSTKSCYLCNSNKETIKHFFFECPKTNLLYGTLHELLVTAGMPVEETNPFTFETVFLANHENIIVNLAAIVAKQKMYSFKCQNKKLSARVILSEIMFIKKYEMNRAKETGRFSRYCKCWEPNTNTTNARIGNSDVEAFVVNYLQNM